MLSVVLALLYWHCPLFTFPVNAGLQRPPPPDNANLGFTSTYEVVLGLPYLFIFWYCCSLDLLLVMPTQDNTWHYFVLKWGGGGQTHFWEAWGHAPVGKFPRNRTQMLHFQEYSSDMLHFANKAGGGGICPSPRTDAVVSYTTTLQKEHLCHIWTKFNHSLRSPQFCGQDRGKGQTDRQTSWFQYPRPLHYVAARYDNAVLNS